jgi:hypothetical protein
VSKKQIEAFGGAERLRFRIVRFFENGFLVVGFAHIKKR